MPKPPPRTLREPVQVYLAPDDSALLNRLATESGLSKAEILRRGVRSYARECGDESPMLRFLAESGAEGWPADGTAADHDAVLTGAYLNMGKSRNPARRKRR